VPSSYKNDTETVVPMYANEVIKWSLVN